MFALGHCCTISTNRGVTSWLLLVNTELGTIPGFRIAAGRGLPAAEVYFEAGSRLSLSRPDFNLIAVYQAILLRLLDPKPPASWSEVGTNMHSNEYILSHLMSDRLQPPTIAFLPIPSITNSLQLRTLLPSIQIIYNAARLSEKCANYSSLSTSLHGRIIATPDINWTLYVFLGVDFDKTSHSLLSKRGQSVTYISYYKTVHSIDLSATHLPLIAVIKLDDLGDHQLPKPMSWDSLGAKVRLLPPEICTLLPTDFDLIRVQALRFLPDVVKHVCDIQNTIHTLDKSFPSCGRIGGDRYLAIIVGLCLDQGRRRGLVGWRTPFGPFGVSHTTMFQRLELLGDAVLGFIVTARLLCMLPDATVGAIVELKAILVRNDTLNQLAQMLKLPQLADFSRQLSKNSKTWADMYEEIIGSIFTGPNGIAGCENFLAKTLISPEYANDLEEVCPAAITSALEKVCDGSADTDDFMCLVDYACEKNINVFCSPQVSAAFLERLKTILPEELSDWYKVGLQFSDLLILGRTASIADVIAHIARGLWLGSPGFCVKRQLNNDESKHSFIIPILYMYHRGVQHPALYGTLTEDTNNPVATRILSLCEHLLAHEPEEDSKQIAARDISMSLGIPIPSGSIPFLVQLLRLALTPHLYQKLELLGDAFLKCSLATYLHIYYPTYTEDVLTQMRQSAETNNVLGALTKKFPSSVINTIKESHAGIQSTSKVYGDVFEAILAAILLACGEDAAGYFVKERVLPYATVTPKTNI